MLFLMLANTDWVCWVVSPQLAGWPLAGGVTGVGNRFGQSRDKLDQLLNENQAAFKDFESNGYPQLPALMADLKKVVRDYPRLWAEIRDDPGRFFLGDRSEGFQP